MLKDLKGSGISTYILMSVSLDMGSIIAESLRKKQVFTSNQVTQNVPRTRQKSSCARRLLLVEAILLLGGLVNYNLGQLFFRRSKATNHPQNTKDREFQPERCQGIDFWHTNAFCLLGSSSQQRIEGLRDSAQRGGHLVVQSVPTSVS